MLVSGKLNFEKQQIENKELSLKVQIASFVDTSGMEEMQDVILEGDLRMVEQPYISVYKIHLLNSNEGILINNVNCCGRVGSDVETKEVNGATVANFSVAVNQKDNTDWYRISAWDKKAENLAKYLNKGDMVLIIGKLKSRTKNDQTYYNLQVQGFQFLPKGNKNKTNNKQENDFLPDLTGAENDVF